MSISNSLIKSICLLLIIQTSSSQNPDKSFCIRATDEEVAALFHPTKTYKRVNNSYSGQYSQNNRFEVCQIFGDNDDLDRDGIPDDDDDDLDNDGIPDSIDDDIETPGINYGCVYSYTNQNTDDSYIFTTETVYYNGGSSTIYTLYNSFNTIIGPKKDDYLIECQYVDPSQFFTFDDYFLPICKENKYGGNAYNYCCGKESVGQQALQTIRLLPGQCSEIAREDLGCEIPSAYISIVKSCDNGLDSYACCKYGSQYIYDGCYETDIFLSETYWFDSVCCPDIEENVCLDEE